MYDFIESDNLIHAESQTSPSSLRSTKSFHRASGEYRKQKKKKKKPTTTKISAFQLDSIFDSFYTLAVCDDQIDSQLFIQCLNPLGFVCLIHTYRECIFISYVMFLFTNIATIRATQSQDDRLHLCDLRSQINNKNENGFCFLLPFFSFLPSLFLLFYLVQSNIFA